MTSKEQLQEEVRGIALELEAVACGKYNFSTCEIADDDGDDYGDNDGDDYTDGDDESAFEGGFERYFADALDLEFRIDSQMRYRGAIVTVAVGGPTIYVDTCAGEVRGYWGSDKATAEIWRRTCNAIDECFEEYFNSLR